MRLGDLLEPNNLRPAFAAWNAARRADWAFVRTLADKLVLRRGGRPRLDGPVFPKHEPWSVPSLAGKRIGLVATGGSGTLASLVGVQRAFEEAGVEVAGLSASSGAMLFAAPWAAGLRAEEVADFWLELDDRDYLDPRWRAILSSVPHAFRGVAGLLEGAALESSFRHRLGELRLGQTPIPLSTVVWNIDLNRLETVGSRATPALAVARAARVAISIPIMVEPVAIGGHLYGDGGIVDIFPVGALLESAPPFDVIFGVNCYYPPDFAGEELRGWHEGPWPVLTASGQLRYAVHLQLAREQLRKIADKVVMLTPLPYEEARAARFYTHFLDRSSWPEMMRAGYASARAALERLEEPAARHPLPLVRKEPLSSADLSWLRMEEPNNPMTITALLRFDTPIDPGEMRVALADRLLPHDRFRQRALGAEWVDSTVDLEAHVTSGRVADETELAAMVGERMSRPLDRSRPLWQLHLVALDDGSGAAIVRLHHAVGDGTALVRLLLALFDEGQEAPPLRSPSERLHAASLKERIINSGDAARALAHLLVLRDPPTPLAGTLGPRKLAAWSPPVEVAPLAAACRASGATLNDLVMTAAAGALGSWLRRLGHPVDELHAIVPVDLRVLQPEHLGNEFGLVFAPLAVGIEDPLARLAAVRRAMRSLKSSPEAALTFDLLRAASRAGASIEHQLVRFFAGKASLVFTNVRGPEKPLALLGHPLRSHCFWAPQSGGVGLGLSVFSYAGELRLGVSSDAGVVADPRPIATAFAVELHRLAEAIQSPGMVELAAPPA